MGFGIFSVVHHRYYPIQNISITPKRNSCLFASSQSYSLVPSISWHHWSTFCLYGLPIVEISCELSHIICDSFCVWILSFSTIFAGFIHVTACVSTSCLIMDEYYSIVWISHISTSCQLNDIWIVSTLWMWWKRLLWTFICKFLYAYNFFQFSWVFT